MKKLLKEIAEVASLVWTKGWGESNAGNISVLIDNDLDEKSEKWSRSGGGVFPEGVSLNAGSRLLITGTGTRMRDIADRADENMVLLVPGSEENTYDILERKGREGDPLKPTSELPSHLAIHSVLSGLRPADRVIIHTHATELISLTHNSDLKSTDALTAFIWSMHPEARIFLPGGVGFVPWETPGSMAMAVAVAESLRGHRIVVAEKHGVFATAPTAAEAFDLIDIASKSVAICITCKNLGFEPEKLSPDKLKALGEIKF